MGCTTTQGMAAALAMTITLALPASSADNYKIDPLHSSLTFSVQHMGINNVKGHFKEYEGSVGLEGDQIKNANGTIQVKSIDTGVQKRDDHLRTADFFDAAKYPTITFKTKRVEKAGEQTILVADFTMRGVTKEIRLPVKVSGPIKDPQADVRIGLEGKAKLNRKDYGINFHQVLDSGVLGVADEVALEINAEAIKQKED